MELEVYKKSDFYEDCIDSQKEYYERENADVYFAERIAEKDDEIAELKAKLENVQASMYCDVVDANMSELKDIRRWKWSDRGFLELDDNGNLCEWDDVNRILDEKDNEINALKLAIKLMRSL